MTLHHPLQGLSRSIFWSVLGIDSFGASQEFKPRKSAIKHESKARLADLLADF